MKKVLSMALAALMLSTTSCIKGDDDITRAQIYMYNLIEDTGKAGDPLTLTQSYTNYEINYTKPSIICDVQTLLADGLTCKFNTGEIQLNVGTNSYLFSKASAGSAGMSIANLQGQYDPTMGIISYDYVLNGDTHIYSLTSFAYNFAKFKVTDIASGDLILETDEISFGLQPKADKKLTLMFANFLRKANSTAISVLNYQEIPYEMTSTGLKSSVKDEMACAQGYTDCKIKNLELVVNAMGKHALINFDMDGAHFEGEGTLYYMGS